MSGLMEKLWLQLGDLTLIFFKNMTCHQLNQEKPGESRGCHDNKKDYLEVTNLRGIWIVKIVINIFHYFKEINGFHYFKST